MKANKLYITLLLFVSITSKSQVIDIGKSFINLLLIEKNYSKSYSYLDESVKIKISETLLKDTVEKLEIQLGQFKSILEVNNEKENYFYYSDFNNMKMDIKIRFNENSKIMGFFFAPHKEFKKENSLGKNYNIQSENIELKGTLLIPEDYNLKKLVIFIHGSGPQDRDETIFENKPFREIAEYLYSNGVSSYRFDKRTLSHPESFSDKSTIDDEVTNDVLNIVHFFKVSELFSDYKIILLGHSFGANLMPRIANKTDEVDKLILLAGNARPLDEVISEQYDYLFKLNPTQEMKGELAKIKEQIVFLNSKKFSVKASKEKLPFELSGYYWKSISDHRPLKEIKKIKIPILILQGERDYQVTMKDFSLWNEALKKNEKTTFISYPKLNHLFITGEIKSDPNEYAVKGNVDIKVINDILEFIIN